MTAEPYRDFERLADTLRLQADGLPENILLLDTVDSTNRFVKDLIDRFFAEETTPRPALVVACEQTAGRGRQGRSWISSAGRGLYCTWLQPLPVGRFAAEDQLGTLPLLVGVGVCRAVAELIGGEARLKWPNDVLVRGRKIAGILIETVAGANGEMAAVIGFGVNYDFGAGHELPTPMATSLALETGALPSRAVSIERLAISLERELDRCGDLDYTLAAYRACTVHREGDEVSCRVGGETFAGRFAGFDDGGRFLLRTVTGLCRIASGEVIEGQGQRGGARLGG